MDKKDEETHAMDKPKPLEVVSDGDLSEVKKDPVWKTWLKQKDYLADERRENTRRREQKINENIHGDFSGDPDKMTPTPKQIEWKKLRDEKEAQEAARKKPKGRPKKKAWEVWLDNVTKPIPDSKGGRGSFQHCIDANQDKNNPGGWCKQIERKISKAKKKKEVKLPQTKIDEPKHWWDHSKVGRQGDIDQKTGRPWWEVATEEKERRKRESKKIAEKPESDYYMDAGGNPQRKEKTDYFVEEIRANIIYHNKVFPLIGMIAGQAARGLGKLGKKVGSEVLEGAGQVGQDMMQQDQEEEEQ